MSLSKSRFIEMFDLYKEKKLSEVAEIIMGQSPDSNSYNNTEMGLPFYQGKTEFSDKYIGSPVTWCSSPCRIAEKNDILMSVRAPVGDVNIATEKCCIGRGLASIRPLDGESTFLFYALKLKKAEIASKGNGSTFKAINKETVHSITIPDVPQELKVKFSMFAEQIDKSKFLLQKILEKLELLKKSRFIEMFGTIQDSKFPKESLEKICLFIKDGTHQTPTYTDDKINGYKFLSSKDVTSKKIEWNNIKYIPKELHEKLYSKLSPKFGDILLAKNGTTGVAAIVETDEVFDIYVSLALIRPNSDINVKYLWSAINSDDSKHQFDSSLKGIGVPNLHLGEIKKTKIIIPPLKLQQEYALFVDQIDKSKLVIQKSLEDLVGKS